MRNARGTLCIIVFENLRFRPFGIRKREAGIFKNLHSK